MSDGVVSITDFTILSIDLRRNRQNEIHYVLFLDVLKVELLNLKLQRLKITCGKNNYSSEDMLREVLFQYHCFLNCSFLFCKRQIRTFPQHNKDKSGLIFELSTVLSITFSLFLFFFLTLSLYLHKINSSEYPLFS